MAKKDAGTAAPSGKTLVCITGTCSFLNGEGRRSFAVDFREEGVSAPVSLERIYVVGTLVDPHAEFVLTWMAPDGRALIQLYLAALEADAAFGDPKWTIEELLGKLVHVEVRDGKIVGVCRDE